MTVEKNVQGICHPSLEVLYGLDANSLTGRPQPEWSAFIGSLNRKPRRAIMFTASVKQAEMACNILNRVVPGIAEWVHAKTNKEERIKILTRFAYGETSVVVNCGVLIEGYDNPHVEVIFIARPTLSRALFEQMIGRSTRTLPGLVDGLATVEERRAAIKNSSKPYCRIIDFAGNSGKHKLITAIDILGGRFSEEAKVRAMGELLKGKPKLVCKTLSNAELAIENERRAAAKRARELEEEWKKKVVAKSNFSMHHVNPFDTNDTHKQDLRKAWNGHGPSALLLRPKQINVLRKAGFDPAAIPLGYGKMLIGKILHKWYPHKYAKPEEK